MAKFKPYIKDQLMLFPQSINDYVPDSHLARLVDRVVEELDTNDIENKYSELGQNTYHPKILVKLLFYGYTIGERSGRMIAKKTETDTAYIYLAQMYKPDFRTINDFRKNNIGELSRYFIDIVRLCKDMGMIKIGRIHIDGTKIKANAANRLTKDRNECEEWLKETQKTIDDILKEANHVDEQEDSLYGDKRGDELPDDINTEEKLKAKLKKALRNFKTAGEKINLTDPDARFMKGGDGKINANYNCQLAVTENQIIVGTDVITIANDRTALKPTIEITEDILKEPVMEVIADTGYSSYENYEYLSKNEKTGYIPDQNITLARRQIRNKYSQENFSYDKKKDIYICPGGQELSAYKVRRKDSPSRRWRQVTYKASGCHTCPGKALCTTQPQRTIERDDRRILLEEMRRRLFSKEGREKYKKRLGTIEPVIGNIKHNLGYRYFLLRTLKKVQGEFRLMCIGHNLKKIHRFVVLPA